MRPQPITAPVYLRIGRTEAHIGDLEIPAELSLSHTVASTTAAIELAVAMAVAVDENELRARTAALLRTAADRLDQKGAPDAAA